MKKILKEIQQGKFARQWIRENANGRKKYNKLMKADLNVTRSRRSACSCARACPG
jgi:ketol-acid reductoisomerase